MFRRVSHFFEKKQTPNLQVICFYCPLEQKRKMQAMENVKTNILTELLKKSWYFGEKIFREKPHFWLTCLQTASP